MSTSSFFDSLRPLPPAFPLFHWNMHEKRGLPLLRQAPHCVQHLQNDYGSVAVLSTFFSRYRSSTRFSVSKRLLYWTLS